MTTDPYGQYHSPYVGMGNDPVNGVDPDGGFWQELGNWIRGYGWISNAGRNFAKSVNGTVGELQGDRLTGFTTVSYLTKNNGGETVVNIKPFNAVQDYTFNGVDVYLDFDFNVTAGLRAAMIAEGLSGFDVNVGSVKLANYNFVKNKWSHIGDGSLSYSAGFSAAVSGVGGAFDASIVQVDGKAQNAILSGSVGIAGVNFKGAMDLAQKKLSGTLSYSKLKFGIGL